MSGKKDDFFDAACLADMGRTRRHQIRELAADSDIAEAVKIAARAHQKLVWERTRHRCGCGRRCGSTSRPRWRPTRT